MAHHDRRIRRWLAAALAACVAAGALVLLVDPPPVEAQSAAYCRTDVIFKNRTRRVTGSVNVECGDECTFGFCHTPPWGNWGVTSAYRGRIDGDQFKGWHLKDGHRQWNSCTRRNIPGEFNNGLGRQRAAPDDEQPYASGTTWRWAGYRNRTTCDDVTPEVRTERNVAMEIYELDPWSGLSGDRDDHVATLNYGTINTRITCSTAWNCSGRSAWRSASASNGSGVSAQVRVSVQTAFVYR